MIQQRRRKYGYKGWSTALNGLTNWMYDNVQMKGSTNAKYRAFCVLIVQYAVDNIPGFVKKGQPEYQADYVARKIQRNNKFQHFINWLKLQN